MGLDKSRHRIIIVAKGVPLESDFKMSIQLYRGNSELKNGNTTVSCLDNPEGSRLVGDPVETMKLM
ncbi:MAG: hypothetical protein A2489_00905 [Candidatus Moranbacteria bacterium RIFOXYC12_FULL_36_13]|nr:MAG: hypothetical protein A2489_00905 [Candidatus Moranbacteria bacterium RIFOXYC12_FULL_36_13]